jgi:choline dehydrogenase
VLLLEAGGPDRNIWIHIPLGYGKLFRQRQGQLALYDSEPEPELNNRRIIQPRGKVLGGSSSINGLLYIRGQHEDFDHWRQLGNTGWAFKDVLPYFRRAEDQERGADELHGVGGPLAVSNVCEPHPLCEAFIAAAQQPAFRATTISTDRARKAPAISSSRPATAAAGRRRSAICGRRGGGPI